MSKQEKIIIPIIGIILLSIFTFTDLQISQTLFTKNLFGRIFEVIGELPFTFIAVLGFMLLFRFRSRKNTAVSILLGIIYGIFTLLFSIMGGFMSWNYLHENIAGAPQALAFLFTAIILIAAYFLIRLVPAENAKEAVTFAIIAIFYFIVVIIVMNTLKGMWGRMRIREMTDPITEFTRWYVITNRGGFNNIYASFPSGHSMNAAGTIAFSLLPSFIPNLKNKEKLIKIICYVYMILCAISRVVMGAHFASDTTAGILLSLLIFEIVRTIVCKIRKNKIPKNS